MQQYTVKKGYYRKRDLSLLATSLGFPGTLFVNRFSAHYTENAVGTEAQAPAAVSEKMITRLLSSGVLFKKLEKVFNEYPAWYNIKLIRKAMQHIRHRSLSFSDISECRIAFELYAYEDGSGLPAEPLHVQRALKMLERVTSPSQLQVEIQRFNEVSDVPSRLQLYEFMDIAAICRKKDEVQEERRLSEISLSGSGAGSESSRELSVADFDKMLMTTDERVSAYLESNYQHSRLSRRSGESTLPQPELDPDHIVHTDSRKSLVSLAAEQARVVTPCLERSQSQLHASRSGFYILSHEHFKTSHLPSVSTQSKSHRAHSINRRRRISSSEDPLKKIAEDNCTITSRNPVRVHLQHRKMRNPVDTAQLTPRDETRLATPSERLGKTINDTCADSVVRARETLHSSMSLISPLESSSPSLPLQDTTESEPATHTPVKLAKVRKSVHSLCGGCDLKFHLEPIVRQEDREEQQFLIDNLLWSTRRLKHRSRVIE